MAESNREQIIYEEESSYGVLNGSPSMTKMRFTSESLIRNVNNVVSQEIRSDRQISDLVQVSKDSSGDVNFELSYGSHDEFFESALFSSFSTAVDFSGSDIAADATGLTSSSTDFTAQNIAVGMWIKVSGFTGDTDNNTYYRVTSVSANDLNLSPAPASADASGETVSVKGSYLRNGTTQKSFNIEKGMTDVDQYFLFLGQIVNNFSLNITAEQIITGSFGFMGKDATLSQSSADSSATAAPTTEIVSASNDVASIRENDTLISTSNHTQSLSFSALNNLRKKPAVSSDSLISVGNGAFDLTGTISTYFDDETLINKFYNGTETSIDFLIEDSAGNAYIFDFPRVKYESGNVAAQGQNQDNFVEMNFRALVDQTYDFTMQICRFPA